MAERVLVSGGSGGLGHAVCRALAAAGIAPVVAHARGSEAAQRLAEATGGLALPLDLADEASIDAAVAALAASGTPTAGVVLAAAPRPRLARFGRIRREDLEQQWRVQVLGPQRLLAGLLHEVFRSRRRGTVVGVLSAAMGADGVAGLSSMGAYVSAKYGLAGLLASLAADHPWLRVETVRPGFVETPMLEVFDARFLEMQRARQPFQKPEEVAREIVDCFLRDRAAAEPGP